MPAAHGRTDQGVIARLLAEPHRFGFFQAVRLALQWLAEQGVPPDRALVAHLQFRNSLSLAFPPSEIEALGFDADARKFTITPAFMGMLGTHGALPAHVTEQIAAWQHAEHDEAPRALLDMLSTRMLALFYQAWCKYRIEHLADEDEDGYRPLLLALAGHASGAVPADAVALHAGLLQQKPVSSLVLGQILSGYLGVPVAVKEMVDFWDDMAPGEQTALGLANAALGDNAVAGERCWRPDLRVRLVIGPLGREQYERFLPGRAGARALADMLALIAEPMLAYEIVLVLRADEAATAILSGRGRLGLDGFLSDRDRMRDRTDLRYVLHPLAVFAKA
jgi:type VI secretion system protein ImpH